MNQTLVLIVIGFSLFLFQGIFFIICFKWISNGKKNRDKEFALLDSERKNLIHLQTQLKDDVTRAKKISDETLRKLQILGTEVQAEWDDVTRKMNSVLVEVDKQSFKLLDHSLSQISIQKMTIEKILLDARDISINMEQTIKDGRMLLRLFDNTIPKETIIKEIQSQKYGDAKKMLSEGLDASQVCKKLGLSMGEVVTLSSLI